MIFLPESIAACRTRQFSSTLKRELESLNVNQLPLQQGLKSGGYVTDIKHSVMIINISEDNLFVYAKVGVFFSSLIVGCNCADDPSPIEPANEYCELLIALDKQTGEARLSIHPD